MLERRHLEQLKKERKKRKMKTAISILVGITIFIVMIFVVDVKVARYIVSLIPITSQWIPLIKFCIWIVLAFATFGLSIWLGFLIGGIVRLLLGK